MFSQFATYTFHTRFGHAGPSANSKRNVENDKWPTEVQVFSKKCRFKRVWSDFREAGSIVRRQSSKGQLCFRRTL